MLKRKAVRVVAVGVSLYPWYLARSVGNIASFRHDAITCKYSELADKKINLLEKICLPVKLPGSESCMNILNILTIFCLEVSREYFEYFDYILRSKLLFDVRQV